LPGLTRQSIVLAKPLFSSQTFFFAKEMAPRVISASTRVFDALLPAGDVSGTAVNQTTRQRGYGAAAMTASSYLPEPMPVSAKMPWSAIHLKVSS
jgi:hypothetical protein